MTVETTKRISDLIDLARDTTGLKVANDRDAKGWRLNIEGHTYEPARTLADYGIVLELFVQGCVLGARTNPVAY